MTIRTFIRLIQVLNYLFLSGTVILIISPLFSMLGGAYDTSLFEELLLWGLLSLLLLRYALLWLPVKKSRYTIQFQSLLQKMKLALPFELSLLAKDPTPSPQRLSSTADFLANFRLTTTIYPRSSHSRNNSNTPWIQFTEEELVLPAATLTWKDMQDWRYKRSTNTSHTKLILSGVDADGNDYDQELTIDGLDASPLNLLLLLSWFKTLSNSSF